MSVQTVDVLSPAVYLDGPPWERFAWLRANAPVYHHVLDDPVLVERCWVVTRHEDVRIVSRDPATFSSASGIHLRRAATHHFRPNMINMDDPDHARVRKLVSGGFTPRVVRAFERHYADLAAGVLDRALAAGGTFDGVEALAAELPLLAICEILGAPEADRFRIFTWSNTLLSSEDPDYAPTPEAFQAAVMGMVDYAAELADRHRGQRGDDLVSALLGPDGTERRRLVSDDRGNCFRRSRPRHRDHVDADRTDAGPCFQFVQAERADARGFDHAGVFGNGNESAAHSTDSAAGHRAAFFHRVGEQSQRGRGAVGAGAFETHRFENIGHRIARHRSRRLRQIYNAKGNSEAARGFAADQLPRARQLE